MIKSGVSSWVQGNRAVGLCLHCQNPLSQATLSSQAASRKDLFCCSGCECVYELLQSQHLGKFYDLQSKSSFLRRRAPVDASSQDFSYLDQENFQKLYIQTSVKNDRPLRQMNFYLEGVHCAACLWLIEKIPDLMEGVQSVHLDLGRALLQVCVNEQTSFSSVAHLLQSFGYVPHPLQKEEDFLQIQKKENRSLLMRLGVAALCAGNSMLMSVSLYGGAEGSLARFFAWLSFFIFLPVLFYCSQPFYQSAKAAWRNQVLSIDVPVFLAVWVGFSFSSYNLIRGSNEIYFDSLSMLVFLLLVSRYVLRRVQQNLLVSSSLLSFFIPEKAYRFNPAQGEYESVFSSQLKVGDFICVKENEKLPADGLLRGNEAWINQSILTGEVEPVQKRKGEKLFCGATNIGAPLQLEVTALGQGTRLGNLLHQIESEEVKKSRLVRYSDTVSKYFIALVLLIASGVFLYFLSSKPYVGLERALSLIIVTCPCTFAFAIPLSFSLTLKKASQRGFILKNAEVLERLNKAENLLLDKTGTLTRGEFEVLQWMEEVQGNSELKNIVYHLEKRSRHPLGQALIRYLAPFQGEEPRIENYQETLGKGIRADIQSETYEIRALDSEKFQASPSDFGSMKTRIGIWKHSRLIAQAILGDKLREDSQTALQALTQMGLKPFIVSGDNAESVAQVGNALGIAPQALYSRVSPEGKKELAQQIPNNLMVGDGANDALALSYAGVGIAVKGSMEVSLKAADVYLTQSGLTPVAELVKVSRETFKVLKRNLCFSVFYNVLGGLASMLGMINPLMAAILMPLSSLTVLSSAFYGTKTLRRFGKGESCL